MSISQSKTEVRSLTGLRGIAALSVALAHYAVGNLVPAFAALDWWKGPAVDLFFCLSGFTMCLAYRVGEAHALPFRNYLVARFARIYPLYIITLAICAFIAGRPEGLTPSQYHQLVWDYVRQITMTNAWSVLGSGVHFNSAAWSVSVEFFCYLCIFPPLFYLFNYALRYKWPVRLIATSLLMAASCYVFVNYFDWRIFLCGRDPACGIPEIAYSVNLLRGILGFSAGWAIYASFLAGDPLSRWSGRNADWIALAVIALLLGGIVRLFPVQLMILGFPLLILGVSSESSIASRILSSRPLVYLGEISYSIYLIHVPWMDFGKFRAGLFPLTPPGSLSTAALLVGGMLALSILSYHFVEMPLRRIIRAAWSTKASDRPPASSRRKPAAIAVALGIALAVAVGWRNRLYQPVPPERVQVGQDIVGYPVFERAAEAGWGKRENWGIWSVGSRSTLEVGVAAPAQSRLRLAVKGSFYLNDRHPALTARIMVNGAVIATLIPTASSHDVDESFPLPPASQSNPDLPLKIELLIDSPASPKSLGLSGDERSLGLALQSMKLVAD
jgi:peptidoglycan/LPS O-acetylase OafA/YrhL